MKLNLSPQRRDETLEVSKAGDVLTINGVDVDLSVIPEGATYPSANDFHEFLSGPISREGGELELTLLLPHGPDAEQWQTFPDPIESVSDGDVDLPFNTYSETEEEDVEGGVNRTVTTYRWHQNDEVNVTFIPAPVVEPEEEE